MLYMAITTNDGVIVDNFYKDGLGIEVRTEQDMVARNLGLNANLKWAGRTLSVELKGLTTGYPDQLSLLIVFPTKSSRDIQVLLNHQGAGVYKGALTEEVTGTRQLQLEPVSGSVENSWRLHAKAQLPPLSSYVALTPKAQ